MAKRKQSPAQLANLKLITESTASEYGKRGAIASNKVKAEKKSMREWAKIVGEMAGSKEVLARLKSIYPEIDEGKIEDITNNLLVIMRLYQEAIVKGNMRAFDLLLELTGQKVVKQEIEIKEPRKFLFEIKKSK